MISNVCEMRRVAPCVGSATATGGGRELRQRRAANHAMTNLSRCNKTARKNITAPFASPTASPRKVPREITHFVLERIAFNREHAA